MLGHGCLHGHYPDGQTRRPTARLVRPPSARPAVARPGRAAHAALPGVAVGDHAAADHGRHSRRLLSPLREALAQRRGTGRRAGDYAQAMMDLGATVCTPRRPRCVICPLMEGCRARALGLAEELPRRAPKADKPTRRGVAFVLMRKDGAVLLRKRPTKGLLGGMDEVPSSAWREGKLALDAALQEAPVPANWKVLDGLVRHTFTHFHLELAVARAVATTAGLAKLAPGAAWVTVDRMTERALPTVMRKVIAHAVQA